MSRPAARGQAAPRTLWVGMKGHRIIGRVLKTKGRRGAGDGAGGGQDAGREARCRPCTSKGRAPRPRAARLRSPAPRGPGQPPSLGPSQRFSATRFRLHKGGGGGRAASIDSSFAQPSVSPLHLYAGRACLPAKSRPIFSPRETIMALAFLAASEKKGGNLNSASTRPTSSAFLGRGGATTPSAAAAAPSAAACTRTSEVLRRRLGRATACSRRRRRAAAAAGKDDSSDESALSVVHVVFARDVGCGCHSERPHEQLRSHLARLVCHLRHPHAAEQCVSVRVMWCKRIGWEFFPRLTLGGGKSERSGGGSRPSCHRAAPAAFRGLLGFRGIQEHPP